MHASGVQGTFGKAMVGLKVTRFDGGPHLDPAVGVARAGEDSLGLVLMLGYLIAAVLPRKQGLHDLLAATYVVREGPRAPLWRSSSLSQASRCRWWSYRWSWIAALKKMGATWRRRWFLGPDEAGPAPAQDWVKQALRHVQEWVKQAVGSSRN